MAKNLGLKEVLREFFCLFLGKKREWGGGGVMVVENWRRRERMWCFKMRWNEENKAYIAKVLKLVRLSIHLGN